MVVTVQGPPHLPGSGYYELFLTQDGKSLKCGIFNVKAGDDDHEVHRPVYVREPTTLGS